MKILQLLRDNAARPKQPVNLVRNEAEVSLYIYDVISADWGVSALEVIDALAHAGDAEVLNVHFNSPGGDVFEGRAIQAALGRFTGKKIAHIDSLCASAATSIALACDEVRMSEGAFFMIHNARGLCFGEKKDMRDMADTMEKVEGVIAGEYVTKTGKDEADVRAWMDKETWFTANEAKEHGFADSVVTAGNKPKNTWNLAAFANVPKALVEPPDPEPKAQAEPPPDPAPTNTQEEPAAAGFFMSETNANRLRLAQIA